MNGSSSRDKTPSFSSTVLHLRSLYVRYIRLGHSLDFLVAESMNRMIG